MRWMTAVLSGAVVVGITGLSLAEEWPHWLGPNRNGISTETGLAASWPENGPKQLWTHTVGIGYVDAVAVRTQHKILKTRVPDRERGWFIRHVGSVPAR